MTALPSFIELMDSLGLEQTSSPSPELSPSPPPASPSPSPRLDGNTAPSPTRSKSSPSLRDFSPRHRAPRYSPYSQSSVRRGSTSSSSSSSDLDCSEQCSASPPPSSLRARRSRNQLTVNVYGSISDLPAYTPISSYVRRKTPGASPTSPAFPRAYESVDITLPILPSFPNSASTDSSFPKTPASDIGISSPRFSDKTMIINESADLRSPRAYRRWHTGVRISTPPYSAGIDDINRRRLIPHFA